jgi:signal peptidase I
MLEARYIPSGSMLPGLQLQDRLLVEKLSYRQPAAAAGRDRGVPRAAPLRSGAAGRHARRAPLRCLLANLPLSECPAPGCRARLRCLHQTGGGRSWATGVVINPRGQVQVNGQWIQEP